METATLFSICIAVFLVGLTGYTLYTAFGPPAESLRDPFDEHED
ncbi:MAG: photosystem II reaction center protein PsbN [Gloeomargaritaceae cyanobacterium C42_A2020_066]|nr:photosystem II reaction center protein PsbN [Gloeomargaritaceae cyanobacterium C42_A2020_066]